MVPEIKICGITNTDDAEMAFSAGASILGVVLSDRSPRKGTPELVRLLSSTGYSVAGVYTEMKTVKLFSTDEDYIQLHFKHGRNEIDFVHDHLGKKTISVVFPEGNFLDVAKEKLEEGTDLVLVDFGRDITEIVPEVIPDLNGYKIGLAGRISADNLPTVVKHNPYFIDLSSKLEKYPGKKDHESVKKFMEVFRNETSAL